MTTIERPAVTAVMPCHREPPAAELIDRVLAVAARLVIVDDGMPAAQGRRLRSLAAERNAEVLRLLSHAGKGHALAAGMRAVRADPDVDAVLALDADGQHPPELLARFIAASSLADLVIGDRFGEPRAIPVIRRVANQVANAVVSRRTGVPIPDSQCGMRLICRRALHEVVFRGGGMAAETRHLADCLRAGVAVAWVPIPAIYMVGQPSAFRPLRDGAAVLAAALAAGPQRHGLPAPRSNIGAADRPPQVPLHVQESPELGAGLP